jgi:photosystem II stability/assembly factor-like uncharacterized protein
MPNHSIVSGLEAVAAGAMRRALQVACCFAAVLGPAGTAAGVLWTSNGPNGGTVTAVAAHPTEPIFYAATNGGGFFRSVDAGVSWAPINAGVPVSNFGITGLTIDPWNPARLWATAVTSLPGGGGVFRSTDGGASWTFTQLGNLSDVVAPGFTFGQDTVIAVGATLLRSFDAGATWTEVSDGAASCVTADPTAPFILYAGSRASVLKSHDGGLTWAPLGIGLPVQSVQAIVVHPTTPNVLYAGLNQAGVYKSTDSGVTWTSVGPAVGASMLSVTDLAIDPASPSTVYAAGSTFGAFGVYKSTDDGATWTSTPLGKPALSLALSRSVPSLLVAGTEEGAWRSRDGAGTWSEASRGMVNTPIQSLATAADPGRVYAGGTNGKVFRSDDGGGSWLPNPATVSPNGIFSLAVDPTNSAIVYAGSFLEEAVMKSSNGGASWSPLSTGTPPLAGFALAVDPTNPAIVYAGSFPGVFRSTQGGDNWVRVSTGIPQVVVALVIDPAAPSTLYAGTDPGEGTFGGVYKTTNAGGLWSPINTGLPSVGGTAVQALALDPASGAVYAGLETLGVYKTTNGGVSWTPASAGLTNLDVTSLRIDPDLPGTVVAGTRGGGVFRSVDGGAAWVAINNGLYDQRVVALGVSGPGRLLAGTAGSGVFVVPACADGVDNDGDGLADHPADPGCASALSDREDPECDDDLDNDRDGAIDWDGGPGGAPADPQCTRPWLRRESGGCGLGFELALLLPPLALWRRARRMPESRTGSARRGAPLAPAELRARPELPPMD